MTYKNNKKTNELDYYRRDDFHYKSNKSQMSHFDWLFLQILQFIFIEQSKFCLYVFLSQQISYTSYKKKKTLSATEDLQKLMNSADNKY